MGTTAWVDRALESVYVPSRRPIKVFLSYARRDAIDLAARLNSDLSGKGFEVWQDTTRIPGGASWTLKIERAIDTHDVLLALLTPGSYGSALCRAEQLRALRKRKRVIPIIARPNSDIPLHLEPSNWRDFTDDRSYGTRLEELVRDIRNPASGARLNDAFRVTRMTAPPLPKNCVMRPRAFRRLRAALVREDNGPTVALTAFEGMGGIGKSVLALTLCHDDAIQEAFPDGVIWVAIGKESTVGAPARLREVGRALNDERGDYESDLAARNSYRTLIATKAALIVLDDVWSATDMEPFLASSTGSRILFTTRDASIAASVGAEVHRAELLSPSEALNVLARWSNTDKNVLPSEALDLISECGRLPLAISMIGAMLREKPREYWTLVLKLLRDAALESIAADVPGYAHRNLHHAIQVSVDALDVEARRCYLALAVMLEDMTIDPEIQQVLWNAAEMDALRTAEQFINLSLAQRDRRARSIRLHDLQLDYTREQVKDKQGLTLIHGAVRLSSSAIETDPDQFAGQLVGRLLPYATQPGVKAFSSSVIAGTHRSWLRPRTASLYPPGIGLVRTLANRAADVAITANGDRAVSADRNDLKIWDLETGRELHRLESHTAPVNGVAITADGKVVVSASDDRTLKVWGLETGTFLRTLNGHAGTVNDVALTADGRALSASEDKTLKLWDVETGALIRSLEGHSGSVNAVAISADGRRAFSASYDHTHKVWDVETGAVLHSLEGHSGRTNPVAISVDGLVGISTSDGGAVKVWNLRSGTVIRLLEGHLADVNGVAITPDGRRVLSGSWDRTLKLWDLKTGQVLRSLDGHASFVTAVALTGDGRHAVSASWDSTVKIWDLEADVGHRSQDGHTDFVSAAAVSTDGRRVVSASHDHTLKVWDLDAGVVRRSLEGHSDSVNAVAMTADGRRAVSASADRTLRVWDLEPGTLLHALEDHRDEVTAVAVTADGRWAVSASQDSTLKVWDLATGALLRTLVGHSESVRAVTITSEKRAVSVSNDDTLKVWDLETGALLRSIENRGLPSAAAVSADGRRFVSGAYDMTLTVWDLEQGMILQTLTGHSDFVNVVAISADGRRAVSGSQDGVLKSWDLEVGRELPLAGHSESLRDLAVSADGGFAVSASQDKTVKVWDLETGTLLGAFTCDATPSVCVFATSQLVLAGDFTGQIHLLAVERGDLV